jgi:hypothetical protein
MNIYKISQEINKRWGSYGSAIVVAESVGEAKNMHPCEDPVERWKDLSRLSHGNEINSTWVLPKNVKVEYIGKASRTFTKSVVLVSSPIYDDDDDPFTT